MFDIKPEMFLGESDFAKEIHRLVRLFEDSNIPIFIYGDEGVGKSFLGNLFCEKFISTIDVKYFNCSELSSSELGEKIQHVLPKEPLSKGIIFIDNLDSVDEFFKIKITDTVRGCPNWRFIFSSGRNWNAEKFCEEIGAVRFLLVPLNERREDIESIARFYMQLWCSKINRANVVIDDELMMFIKRNDWPQNISGLKSFLWNIFSSTDSNLLSLNLVNSSRKSDLNIQFQLGESMDEIELRIIKATLNACGGNKLEAAKSLGINVRTIYRKLEDIAPPNL